MVSKPLSILAAAILCSPCILLANPPPNFSWQTIDDPAGFETVFNGISGNQIVGYYYDAEDNIDVSHAFVYDGMTFSPLSDPSARTAGTNRTIPMGISGGNIVGYYIDSSTYVHGFLYDSSTWTTLDGPNVSLQQGGTYANAVSGDNVVGVYTGTDGKPHDFIYNHGNYTPITSPFPGYSPTPYGISANNIVGILASASGGSSFLYDGSNWKTFQDPSAPSNQTIATGVDGTNIVGYYQSATGYHSFLYDGSTWTPLDDPSAAQQGVDGTFATGISGDKVVGYYVTSTGDVHSFIATIPEPSSILLATLSCLGSTAVLKWLRKRKPLVSNQMTRGLWLF